MGATFSNEKIVGYKFRDQEHKILQYDDGTCMCVIVTESIKECFNVLKIYEKASGAKVNISKTDGMWIGTWSKRIEHDIRYYPATHLRRFLV